MAVNGKDYYLITGMTESFRAWEKRSTEGTKTPQDVEILMAQGRVWELRFQLAIAQQLSVISSHLGQIVESSKTKG
jgi:hypothetical protein